MAESRQRRQNDVIGS